MSKKNKHLCPCGSGRRRKECCQEFSSSTKLAMRRSVEALAKAGKHLEACEILEKLVALSPRNPLIWNDLGVQYEAAGQIDKALVALTRGVQVDATYPPTLYNLGKVTMDRCMRLREDGLPVEVGVQAMVAEAIGFLNASLDRNPDHADCHHYLALAYGLSKNEPMARAHTAVALRLSTAGEVRSEWLME